MDTWRKKDRLTLPLLSIFNSVV